MNPDEGPDRHLQAALRHAPDADVQAPAALRERIVGAARAALAADRPAPWWRRLFDLRPLQLGASGAFATVLIAGVIGLLWRGETPPPVAPAAPSATRDEVVSSPAPQVEPERQPELAKLKAAPAAPATTAAKARAEPERRAREAASRRDEGAGAPLAVGKVAADAAPAAAVPTPTVAAAPTATIMAETVAPVAPVAPVTIAPPPRAADNAAAPVRADRAMSLAAKELSASAALSDEESAWLRELGRTVQGRWRETKAESVAGGRERRFGRPPLDTLINVGGGRVLWCDSKLAPVCREATLAPDDERRLLESMPR